MHKLISDYMTISDYGATSNLKLHITYPHDRNLCNGNLLIALFKAAPTKSLDPTKSLAQILKYFVETPRGYETDFIRCILGRRFRMTPMTCGFLQELL